MHNLYLISIVFIINTSLSATFFDTLCAFWGKTPYETTIKAVYPLAPDGIIAITNIDGNIIIQSDPHIRDITLYATKHTAIKQHLDDIDIIQEEINNNGITLRTSYGDHHIKGSLDYTITVPEDAHITAITQKGSITIKDIAGTIIAKTECGNINIYGAQSNVHASVIKQGDITIVGAQKELNLATTKGNIQVLQSTSNVNATATQGDITITCKKLIDDHQMTCDSLQGDISLYLPRNIQASLDAHAPGGIITSEQPISIAATTTTVNKAYWKLVKTELHGHIGDNPTAGIILTTQKGNIRIYLS